jgi:hypothetical protein
MIQKCGDEVKEEILLAKARVDAQDRELQKKEIEAASGHRRKLRDMLSRTGTGLDTVKVWQMQQDKRRSGTYVSLFLPRQLCYANSPLEGRRRQLLHSLSSHEYLPPFKRACKERHCNTAQWVFETAEFRQWRHGTSPWIWCSGKSWFNQSLVTLTLLIPPQSDLARRFFCKDFIFCVRPALTSQRIVRVRSATSLRTRAGLMKSSLSFSPSSMIHSRYVRRPSFDPSSGSHLTQ